ncbi:MAG: hypothetical protein K0U41_09210, partial [Gammaproteobacteria bacterium]|nr:hypothetical protein [Gammaproteobacteria bacterium]
VALLSNNGVSYKNMTTPTDMFIGFNPREWSRHHDFKLTQALNLLLNTDKVKVGHHRMDAHIITSVSLTELALSHVNRNDALRGV